MFPSVAGLAVQSPILNILHLMWPFYPVCRVEQLLQSSRIKHPLLRQGSGTLLDIVTAAREATPHKLGDPVALSYRDREVDALAEQLRSKSPQLAVVIGVPGMGTSVFSRAVAQKLAEHGDLLGGAYYIDLADAQSRENVDNQ